MTALSLQEIIQRALAIREQYRQLEQKYHQTEWTIEEDALAFLTDAGLVGRLAMAQQQRWPKSDSDVEQELAHKLAENIWWCIVLGERMGIDMEQATAQFLHRMELKFNK